MRFKEIREQELTPASDAWSELDPSRTPSVIWDQIPPYYRGSQNIWALNPNKTNKPLMAIVIGNKIYQVLNSSHFSKNYVAGKLKQLMQQASIRGGISPRSGWVYDNGEVYEFFDFYKFNKIAPASETKFWFSVPMSDFVLGPSVMRHMKGADAIYAALNENSLESAEKVMNAIQSSSVVAVKDNKLYQVPGKPPQRALQSLVTELSLQDSTEYNGSRYFVMNGQVVDAVTMAFDDPQPPLSNGTKIWRVPEVAQRAFPSFVFDKSYKSADTVYLALLPGIEVPEEERLLFYCVLVGVKKGKILGFGRGQTVAYAVTDLQLQTLQNLMQAEMGLGGAKEKFIQPNSNFHRMLQYISEHPLSPRSGWYNRGLGLSVAGMPGITSPKALDGLASKLRLITLREPGDPSTRYRMRITPSGELVLARLNAGNPISLNYLLNRALKR